MFFVPVSRLNHVMSEKKKIKCAAGDGPEQLYFFSCFKLGAGLCLCDFDSSVFRIYGTSVL